MVMNKQAAEYAQKLAYHRGAMLAAAEFEKQAGIMDSPIVQQLRAAASKNRNALIGAGVGAGLGAGAGAAAGGEDHRGSGAALGALGGAALGAGAGHAAGLAGLDNMAGLQAFGRDARSSVGQAAGRAGSAVSGAAGGLKDKLMAALGRGPKAPIDGGIPGISGNTLLQMGAQPARDATFHGIGAAGLAQQLAPGMMGAAGG